MIDAVAGTGTAGGRPRPRSGAATGAVPPTLLVFLAIISVQIGAAVAKTLFPVLGSSGTVFLRIEFAALALLIVGRPRLHGYRRADYGAAVLFGVAIAMMNAAFYAALARIPLGAAVTLEFVGPLGVAIAGSRRRLDTVWAVLAAGGIVLLAPIDGAVIDPLGALLALLAGAGWAAYILLNVRVGRAFRGGDGLALALAVAAVAVLPLGVAAAGGRLFSPQVLAPGAVVALLSTIIPFSLEHAALKRLPARVFGVLMSVEPIVAALVGFVVLHEALGARGLLALVLVTMATVGSARTGAPGGRVTSDE